MVASRDVPRVGISACLLGEKVRWDGGDRRAGVLLEALDGAVRWVAVCPEVELGLGVPREPIRLLGARLIGRVDHTEAMAALAARRVAELRALGIAGYVLKSSSPSCGLDGVKVFDQAEAGFERIGRGAFAAALVAAWPELPVIEETGLDERACGRFLARVVTFARATRTATR